MSDLLPIIILMIISMACVLISYRVGIAEGTKRRTGKDVSTFIKNEWPDQYAAYKRGVQEGYASGLADAKEMPDEPT